MGLDVSPLSLDIPRAKYIPIDADGIKVLSMASVLPRGKALIWEGARRQNVVKEFIHAADWTDTEILLADLPPGVGDETLSMVQYFAPDAAVVVTTPHSFALEDYLRCVDMLDFWRVPVAKTVVNMAYFDLVCPHKRCRKKVHRIQVFKDTNEKREDNAYEVPFDPLISSSNKVDLMPLAKELISRMVVA
jgi:ATP-binding protein involved in chromosome partitioning